MNWLYVGFPLLGFYVIWFGYLLIKKTYSRPVLFFALAHFPYLLVNLVAPFRGVLDPNYAGYSLGWISLPKGIWVTIVVGAIVIGSLFFASRALMNKMEGLWKYAFLFDLVLSVMVALPLLIGVLTNLEAFRLELGEYLSVSGVWVGLLIFLLFTLPTLYACYVAGRKAWQVLRLA